MEIRELNASDFFKLSEIASQISADVVEKISDSIGEKQMGFQIVTSLLKQVPNEIRSFIAHVMDMDMETLDQQRFDYPLKVVKALLEKEEVKSFLEEIKGLLQARFQN